MEKKKICKCKEPGYANGVPGGIYKYRGMSMCTKCSGVINYPVNDDSLKYEGSDDVERYLHECMSGKTDIPDCETAMLKTLLRIEAQTKETNRLLDRLINPGGKKDKEHGNIHGG